MGESSESSSLLINCLLLFSEEMTRPDEAQKKFLLTIMIFISIKL